MRIWRFMHELHAFWNECGDQCIINGQLGGREKEKPNS
jgi:hypothetical protein